MSTPLRRRLAVSHLVVALLAVAALAMADYLLVNRATDVFVQQLGEQIERFDAERGFVPPGLARQQQIAAAPSTEQFRVQTATAALIGAGLAATIAIGLALHVSGLVSQPVRRSARAAGRVAAGERHLDLPVTGIRELDELRAALEQLARDLGTAEQQRDRVVDDVVHELRTPLAVLRGNVEGMRDGAIAAGAPTFERLLAELRRLERLVEDLRSTSELSARDLDRRPLAVSTLLQRAVERHRLTAETGGIRLAVAQADEGLMVVADEMRLDQALDNLVENAMAHAPAATEVTLSAARADDQVRVQVRDEGLGLSPPEQALVFERLYRTDAARDRVGGGAGIGLAVTRRIIDAHGGHVGVESEPAAGATFWFSLPLTNFSSPLTDS